MPLAQRFEEGSEAILAIVAKQRKLTTDAASNADERPPEARIGVMTNDRKVTIDFTEPMSWPDNIV